MIGKAKTSLTPKTIKGKFLFSSLGAVMIPLILTGIISGQILHKRALNDYSGRMDAELKKADAILSSIINSVEMDVDLMTSTESFSHIDSGSFNDFRKRTTRSDLGKETYPPADAFTINLWRSISTTHPDYLELYVGTKYGRFASSGKYMINANYDPRIRPWYGDGMAAKGKVTVAKSYLSASGYHVTAVVKAGVDASGTLAYVAGIDISLEQMSNLIRTITIGRSGYIVIIENDGTIIAHPRRADLVTKRVRDLDIAEFKNIDIRKVNHLDYTFNGVRKKSKIFHSEKTGWNLLVVVDAEEIENNANFYRILIYLSFTLIIVCSGFLYTYIKKDVVIPLQKIAEYGTLLAEGNPGASAGVYRDDEIGLLSDSFDDLSMKLKKRTETITKIIECMPSSIIRLNADGTIIEWNRTARQMYRLSDSDKGSPFASLRPELAIYQKYIAEVMTKDGPVFFHEDQSDDRNNRFFDVSIFPISDDGIIIRADDVTESRKKDIQIQQSQRFKSIGFLVGGVTHDFNNILAGILGTVSFIRTEITLGAALDVKETDRNLNIIEKSCHQAKSIISQLLSLARSNADADRTVCDLNTIIESVVQLCGKTFPKSVAIETSYADTPAYADVNSTQIYQCILNLLINASQAMTLMRTGDEKQGGTISVDIRKYEADSSFLRMFPDTQEGFYWSISIKDTGIGIDSQTMTHIFDPFFTTKNSPEGKGSGLGLSVVYSIIKTLGGAIDVTSKKGQGTVFVLYIPAYLTDTH